MDGSQLPSAASIADVAIGISLAISAEIAFIFEAELDEAFVLSSSSSGSLVHDLVLRHAAIYQDLRNLCEKKNVMFQLLPASVALSRKFDLRKLAIIAPTTVILVDFMSQLFKYVANLTDEGAQVNACVS